MKSQFQIKLKGTEYYVMIIKYCAEMKFDNRCLNPYKRNNVWGGYGD